MAAPRQPQPYSASSGRRGYLLYQYGLHFWVPIVDASWTKGMIRDTARVGIPPGAVYDAADFLLHQPGVAQKRGGTSYFGTSLTSASYAVSILEIPGPQLLTVGSNGHLFSITAAGATVTDKGALNATSYIPPVLSPGAIYTIFPEGSSNAQKYDGSTVSTLAGGMALRHTTTYKSRLVSVLDATPNRLQFSPTPDVNSTWDTTNAWIDCDHQVSGLASLNNAILIFSSGSTERIIGSTPPPNSDMDRAPLFPIGCTDCRSIVVNGPYVFFANPGGVYMTNGTTPVSLTDQGGIESYWRSLFSGYVTAAPVPSASTWTISSTFWRGFLFVCVLDVNRNVQATLMCNIATRAWWRLTNIGAMAWSPAVDGNELYYANGDTNRTTAMSGILSPTASNKNDANGIAVTPLIEFRAMGDGTGIKQYGFGRLTYDMRDAATDNPTMAVTVKTGVEADTSTTPAESPLAETTTTARQRFSVSKSAQSVTIKLQQTNASSKTELYALEVDERGHSDAADGIS